VEALKAIIEFVDAPAEAKRPDVWVMRVNKARSAIARAEQQAEPVQQIAEALRQHGLTLVKTASGYAVVKLGPVVAQHAEPVPPWYRQFCNCLKCSEAPKQAEPVVEPKGAA
jgi:hypothetical protein